MTVNAALDDLLRLRLNPEQAAFQREARAFLQEEMASARVAGNADPGDLTGLSEAFERAHQLRAGARGFLGIALPRELGGGGRPPSWRAIWMYEAAYHDAPSIDTAVVLSAGPLVHFGSAAQKQRWLTPMIRGEVLGCGLFTEREAGSDLAALTTRAEPAGDGWRLHGEKVLITGAHKADIGVLLARTDAAAAPRKAMSMFVLDMRQPGITIRRRPTMNGWTLSEVTFDGVELPGDALIGRPGDGFAIALASLADERSGLAWLAWAVKLVELLAARHDDPRILRMAVETGAARRFCQRVMAMQDAGQAVTYEASVAKIQVTELLQRIARLGADLEGEAALARMPLFGGGSRFGYELVERFHPTFSVGANELQRDTVVRLALDMPRA